MARIGFGVRLGGALSLVACLVVLISGCSQGGKKRKMGKVSGMVSLDGKPVDDGQVHFISKTGYGKSVDLDGTGKYSVAELEATEYQVYVAPHPPGQQAPGTVKAAKPSVIPQKYQQPDTSGLTFTVVEGKDSKFDIELKN
jgi:hypothetical protein